MTTDNQSLTRKSLVQQIEAMRPWHHDIQLTDDLCTGEIFSPTHRLPPKENDGVSLISPKVKFDMFLDSLYPDSMEGKRFLDCACNAGGYCFWAREKGAEQATGFDVRAHWIDQARFVQQHRQVAPTDRIDFHVLDLYDVPQQKFPTADMTYFSGIFYHLPDPITGLKIAADLTSDIIVVNTAMKSDPSNPTGMTMARESTSRVMSGVHELSWFPNGPECIHQILLWLGFTEAKLTRMIDKSDLKRQRIEMIASRDSGRLDLIPGDYFQSELQM